MAENNEATEADEKKPGFIGKLIIWGVVFVLGVGTGAAVPIFTGLGIAQAEPVDARTVQLELMDIPEADDKIVFIEFEEVVSNINDPSSTRFVNLVISLQVAGSQEEAITKLVEEKSPLLKNWLLGHMQDKNLEQLRGKLGVNLLRREIFDKFNNMLFTDGIERIQDVLVIDFKVQ